MSWKDMQKTLVHTRGAHSLRRFLVNGARALYHRDRDRRTFAALYWPAAKKVLKDWFRGAIDVLSHKGIAALLLIVGTIASVVAADAGLKALKEAEAARIGACEHRRQVNEGDPNPP